jgi:hypothetical protein
MSDRVGSADGVLRTPPRWVFKFFNPNCQIPAGRWRSDGLQWAHHHSRPEERLTSHHARGDHPGLRQALGLGSLGRGPMGAQSARCRPCDHYRAPPERRSTCDRAGPDAASRVLSRHPGPSRARHTIRCLVHSHHRWGRSGTSVGSGRGSACLRTPPTLTEVRCRTLLRISGSVDAAAVRLHRRTNREPYVFVPSVLVTRQHPAAGPARVRAAITSNTISEVGSPADARTCRSARRSSARNCWCANGRPARLARPRSPHFQVEANLSARSPRGLWRGMRRSRAACGTPHRRHERDPSRRD